MKIENNQITRTVAVKIICVCLNFIRVCLITFHVRHSQGKVYIGHGHLCVCLSLAAFPHYCTDTDVTRGNGRGCPLVVHYWTYFQSVHQSRCCDNIALNAKCERVLVFALYLVCF